MMMEHTLRLMGLHPVRHKPNKVWAVKLTKENLSAVAEWINENDATAVIQYDDEVPIMWVNGRVASIGEVVIRGTVGEFYAITEQVFRNTYEDIPQDNAS